MSVAVPETRSRLRQGLRRVLSVPVIVVATFLVFFDDLFRSWVKPAVGRLARLRLVQRFEGWIAGLPPYGILALFVVPMAIIEPLKLFALYLIGTGHLISGILTIVVAKIVGIGIAERLFAVGRDKLLSIAWFRWCFERAVAAKDVVYGWLSTSPTWHRVKRWALRIRAAVGRVKAWAAAMLRPTAGGRLAAARRLIGRDPLREVGPLDGASYPAAPQTPPDLVARPTSFPYDRARE